VEIGQEPMQYNWYKNGDLFATSKDITDLAAGDYTYVFSDVNGCIISDTVQISQPDQLAANFITHDACFGINNGLVSIEPFGGTSPYQYIWNNGYDSAFNDNLEPATYQISVSDSNNCPGVDKTIVIGELPEIQFNLLAEDLTCYGDSSGSVSFTDLQGGTGLYSDYEWIKDFNFYSSDPILPSAQAGFYQLTITDDYGCNTTKSIDVHQPDQLSLTLTGDTATVDLGSIDLTVEGGIEPYTYLWNTGATTQDLDPLGGGLYTVEVTDDNDCKATGEIFLEVHFRLMAPTAFSPNGDGVNDEFVIHPIGTDLDEFEMTIYNRFGEIVFETTDPAEFWNGKLNNTDDLMPTEVYTWIANLTYIGGESVLDKGTITLLR